MKGITWSRDSHGLFDYESRHLTKKTMKTHQPSLIIRKENDIDLVYQPNTATLSINESGTRPLVSIVNEDGK